MRNALKHGERAKTLNVMPVLPDEDPRLLEERIQSWIDDWQPKDATEDGLVRRGAKLTWLLERGERIRGGAPGGAGGEEEPERPVPARRGQADQAGQ